MSNRGVSIRRDIFFGIFFALACIAFQHSSDCLKFFSSYNVDFKSENKNGKNILTANLQSLPAGDFYASIGSPRAPCDLYLNDKKIDMNRSEIAGLRNGLFLGAAFRVDSPGIYSRIVVECDRQEGFGGFTHRPVITGFFFWCNFTNLARNN